MGLYRVGAGILVLDKNKDILLLKRSDDTSYPLTWSVIGGSLEEEDCVTSEFPSEDYYDSEYMNCAIRETFEETSINFKNIKFDLISKILTESSEFSYQYMTFVIIVDSLKNITKNIELDLNENIEYNIYSFEDIGSMTRHEEVDKKIVGGTSVHPGLYDILGRVKYEVDGYFKKFKQQNKD